MQQLAQDMQDIEALLLPLCEEMMTWASANVYENFQEAAQPMTTLVSLLLNNKQAMAECGINVKEAFILETLEDIIQALEKKDEILLLDSIYHGYLPWIREVSQQILQFLKGQEG